MEKLTIKELAHYLPYGLNVLDNYELEWELYGIYSNDEVELIHKFNTGSYTKDFKDIKPILRPLSDLTKEIEVDGEKFVPKEILKSMGFSFGDMWDLKKFDVNNVCYEFANKCIEWHFDVFGLIEKGLAIYKNNTI